MPPLEETPREEHSPEQFVSQSSSGNEADDESSRGLQDITPLEENKETKNDNAEGQTEVKPDQKNGKVIEWNKSFKLKKIVFDQQQQQQLERSESSSSSSSSYIGSSLPDDDTKYKLLDSDSDVEMSHNSRQIHLLKTMMK